MFKLAAVCIAAITLLWAAALASARSESFTVLYTGAGKISSQTISQTSPECGEVMETRNENTDFSWVTNYKVTLSITSHGMFGATDSKQPKPSPLVSNDSTVTLSDTGCQPGIANCSGESQPERGSGELDVGGASGEAKSHLKVDAIGADGDFEGKGFSGGWGFSVGSCADSFNDIPLLLPEDDLGTQLRAEFPVKAATFRSLKRGHYFRVKISAGHYAPSHMDVCFADSGCKKDDFSWNGEVKITRDS